MAHATPMMEQYSSIKAQYQDAVLFFRVGDFYEMFNSDAEEVSRLLNLTLTKRGLHPMCGVPYHAAKIYISRLLKLGKKIAICEQIGETIPGQLTQRKVIEVITPGTAIEDSLLDGHKHNYLAAVYCSRKKLQTEQGTDFLCGFAYVDVSTGDFQATHFYKSAFLEKFQKELDTLKPNELLIQQSLFDEIPLLQKCLEEHPNMLKNYYPDWTFVSESAGKKICEHFKVHTLKGFGFEETDVEIPVLALLLDYLKETAGECLDHIVAVHKYEDTQFLQLDDSSRKNLELITNLRDATTSYTLFEVLNQTKTMLGARLLQEDILRPLCQYQSIYDRQEKVYALYKNEKLLAAVRKELSSILDIQRLVSKISMNKANGKDLLSLKQSLNQIVKLVELSKQHHSFFLQLDKTSDADLRAITEMLERSINEECTIAFNDSKLIKQGWSKELDELKGIRNNVHSILDTYLNEEKEKTGLQKLKIKSNKMHGYFFEITKFTLTHTPDHFILLKDLKTSKMFSTEKLQEIQDKIEHAETEIIRLEKELFGGILAKIMEHVALLLELSKEVARLDVLHSFAQVAILNCWVRPTIAEDGHLRIVNGRHPIVEAHIPAGEFIPNDLDLCSHSDQKTKPGVANATGCCEHSTEQGAANNRGEQDKTFALITGPNMAGKSTYLRQNALIVLLAQLGSFVPAETAHICICDKIFCRVGASDNLARGESTFLVEMTETAFILQNATEKSLVIMDEVGRGTSTQDGLAIAQAVMEHLLTNIKAKTIFATHYHELGLLEHTRLVQLKLDVIEENGRIIFLKKVLPGVSENSYGLQVASIAGVPRPVIERASQILQQIVTQNQAHTALEPMSVPIVSPHSPVTQSLFDEKELIIDEIASLDVDSLRPIEALHLIQLWQESVKK